MCFKVISVFGQFGCITKYEITKILVDWYPQLKSREPQKRKVYEAEHYQTGIFDAFALMLTHYYLKD